ncbi:MAG TPA: hypothetical protein VNZ47_11825 [Candidatus Dormibacteraeota bacterium]|jgi:hypothetical protein|nr:hypothetical protein [Candidatus Dormibacteraeota bacterium]
MGKSRAKPAETASENPPATPRLKGRPSKYTPELATTICERMAKGESLRGICREDEMPDTTTILRWLDGNEDFRLQYTRAREAQADFYAEEIVEISDDGANDWMVRNGKVGEDSGYELNGEHVQRSRLRVDARKWFASKVAPKKYGDKQQVEHSGNVTLETLVTEAAKKREGGS